MELDNYCSRCGAKATTDARYCAKCGNALTIEEAVPPPPSAAQPTAEPLSVTHAAPLKAPARIEPAFRLVLLLLLILVVIGSVATQFLLALAGTQPTGKDAVGLILWTSILFYILFRRWGKSGALGALAGATLAIVISIAVSITWTAGKKDVAAELRNSRGFLAIQKYDPMAYRKLMAAFELAAKEPNASPQTVGVKVMPMFLPIAQKALAHTTDDAVVLYARSRLANFEAVASASEDDCAAMFAGNLKPESMVRIASYQSAQNRAAHSEAMTFVIESAIGKPALPPLDEGRYQRILGQVEKRLTSKGLSTDYVLGTAGRPTSKQRCAAGLELFREGLELKDPDRAYFLRALMT